MSINGIPEAAIWRGGPTLVRIKQLQAMYKSPQRVGFFSGSGTDRGGGDKPGDSCSGLMRGSGEPSPSRKGRYSTSGDDHREAAYWADALESHVAAVEFEEEVEIERIKRTMQAARDTARDAS